MLLDANSPSLVAKPAAKRPVLKAAGPLGTPSPASPIGAPKAPTALPVAGMRPIPSPVGAPGNTGIVPPPAPAASPVPGVALAPQPLTPSASPIGQAPPLGPQTTPPIGEPLPPGGGPAAPAGAPPALPIRGMQMTSFGPGNDLRGTQISPSATINRTQLAQTALSDFDAANARPQQERMQAVGQRAAALGRLGMGDTAREIRDTGVQFESERQRYANELARGLAESEVGDARLDRGEMRGERDYQSGQARTAIEDRIRERLLAESLQNGRFNRDMGRYQVGSSFNPSQMELGAADSLNGVAAGAFGGMQGLLMEMARRRAAQPAQAPPVPAGVPLPDPLSLPGNVG